MLSYACQPLVGSLSGDIGAGEGQQGEEIKCDM